MKKISKVFLASLLFANFAIAEESLIRDALQPLIDDGAMSGAVTLVATKDKILDFQAIGYTDVENQISIEKDTIFWIASQSKTVTAVAFLILVDEGKLSIDDSVSKFIPEFANMKVKTEDGVKDAGTPILIKHILAHTSGLPFSVPEEAPKLDSLTLEEAAQAYAKATLMTEPGIKHAYSNAGINIVGRIIEIISGQSFTDFLQERIFTPLEMHDTNFVPSAKQLERLVGAYRTNVDDVENPELANTKLLPAKIGCLTYPLDNPDRQPMPAGGLFSTASDVLIFCQMLANDGIYNSKRIISKDSVNLMAANHNPPGQPHYGLGVAVDTGSRAFGHGGAMGTQMWIDRKNDLITIYMIQRDGNFPKNGNDGEKFFKEAARKINK